MEPASGAEGEVSRAGQLGDRDEVAGDDASGYNSPAGGSNHGEVGSDGTRSSGRPVRKRTRPAQGTPLRPVRYILRQAPSGTTSRRPLLLPSTAHRLTAAKPGISRLRCGSGSGNRLGRTLHNAFIVISTCCEKS
jgi:hypothetical protein